MSDTPPRKRTAHEVDAHIDDVLDKIDQALPKVHERATKALNEGKPSTPASGAFNMKKTRAAFQAMSEDSLLTMSGEDLVAPAPADLEIKTPASGVEKTAEPRDKAVLMRRALRDLKQRRR